MALMLLAAWRLLSRADLDDDRAPRTLKRGWFARERASRMRDLALLRLPRGFAGARHQAAVPVRARLYLCRHGLAAAPVLFPAQLHPALDDRRPARHRRLAAVRPQGRSFGQRAPGADRSPCSLMPAQPRNMPISRSTRRRNGIGRGRRLSSLSSCPSPCAPRLRIEAVLLFLTLSAAIDHHRRRDQDDARRRRLWRPQPDGRQ